MASTGILAGAAGTSAGLEWIDTRVWNLKPDAHLPEPVRPRTLADKRVEEALLEAMETRLSADVLVAAGGRHGVRMVDQKGFDLLADLSEELPAMDATFVVLAAASRATSTLAVARDRAPMVAVWFGFNDWLAHLIEAVRHLPHAVATSNRAAERYGSLKYGTVPVVRAVGGLDDTIDHWNRRTETGTGSSSWR